MVDSSDTRLVELEIERSRLECQKLQVEIEQIRQPLWKRASYIASMSPIILALVAFLSAWITGYFNTERQQLESDIAGLEDRRTQLIADSEAMQKQIDTVYLRLKRTAGEASYAIGHIRGWDGDGRWTKTINKVAEQDIVVDGLNLGDTLRQREAIVNDIVEITEGELEKIDKTLAEVPASDWSRTLYYEPGPAEDTVHAPDGRLYRIDSGLYFDDIDSMEANRPSENQTHPSR